MWLGWSSYGRLDKSGETKAPPFRKERDKDGAAGRLTHPFAKRAKWWGSQTGLCSLRRRSGQYPPFRKEREMVGQPDGAVFAARGSGNTHPFAKSAKWWGSQTGLCSLRAGLEIPTLSQRARNGGAARRGCVRCARVWKYPPFRKEREMVGQPDGAVFAARVWKYPPFRKEREMVGQPMLLR